MINLVNKNKNEKKLALALRQNLKRRKVKKTSVSEGKMRSQNKNS